mmetsp:Transcript_10026/g.29663  ORF Transcript_10026/g.29663 Transcript_10026/m.29663 type:complete len:363 (-) Transcript_10026:219-1307(-)|eukprot:CAMPEP_0113526386 /NCGR_PEP_ID=MMETSP0015_2-20120614/709_1 /TAXON_ID=2838 /ORGANISM="Odontella" /LENGTH=362 /DNA_ID=CAMNT_0000424699 /DNA_START=267 /DNA_END=1355 /DNA_ORIENTATION=- /assembly_acc=CAM_ASM_000160
MGASQSSEGGAADITPVTMHEKDVNPSPGDDATERSDLPQQSTSKVLQTPILMEDGDSDDSVEDGKSFPVPTGREYDLMDRLAADLPSVIDDESRQQVEDYIEACDKGRGPMVACYSTAEYLSLFLRKHKEAEKLYNNTCFRPRKDKSANSVEVDGTKAYAPACFNLAQMRMTGKGGTKFSRQEGYQLFDRACQAGHGGSCHMQAKMLLSDPGALGPGVPYDPDKAAELLENVCTEKGDSISCFTLASMLLRGDAVRAEADNISPKEARGESEIKKRKNEGDRRKSESDERKALRRDPVKAAELLVQGCERGHAPSCYNVAVMYTQGDDGVPASEERADLFKKKTEELVKQFGGFGFGGSMG